MGRTFKILGLAALINISSGCYLVRESDVQASFSSDGRGIIILDTRKEATKACGGKWNSVAFYDNGFDGTLDKVLARGIYGTITFEGDNLSEWQNYYIEARKMALAVK